MRKSIHYLGLSLLFGLACLQGQSPLRAQCINTLQGSQAGCGLSATSITTEIAPTGGTIPVSVSPYSPGSYFRIPVLAGGCYSIGTCGAPFDTQISCFEGSAVSGPFAYDDDIGPLCPSSAAASVTMVPNFTDYANIDVRTYPCQQGGSSSITVTVQQNNNLSITSSTANMCQGQTRTLSAVPIPVSGAQPNSGSSGTFSGAGVSGATFTAPTPSSSNQTYTVSYSFGYITTSQSIVVFHAPTTAAAGPDQTVCASSTALQGNVASFGSGQWTLSSGSASISSPTSPTSAVTGLLPGASAVFRWTISNGVCTSTRDSVVITRTQDPTPANAGGNQSICSDSLVLAANAPSVGSGSWSVSAGSGALVAPSDPNSTVVNLSPGTNVLVWAISNGVCPVSRDSIVIFRDEQPSQPFAGPDKQICESQTSLSANIPVIGNGTWSVISGSGIVMAPATPNSMVSAINVGSTALQWAIVNGTCPAWTDTIVVTRNALPNSPTITGSQTVCFGSSATLSASSNAANPTYLWWDSLSGGNLLAAGTSYTTPPLTSPITVYAEVNDGNTTCSSTRVQYTLNVAALPTVSLGPDQLFCSSDSVCMDAGAGMSAYHWNTGATSRVVCTHNSGTYWVEITDGNGCHATDTINLVATPSPIVNLGPNFTLCTGNSNSIGVAQISGQNYSWSTGASTNNITITSGGTYGLSVSDGSGCSGFDEVIVTQHNAPVAAFTMNTAGCPNIQFTDQSTDSDAWTWSFGNGNSSSNQNSSHVYATNGTYTVTLITSGPCGSDTSQQALLVDCIVGLLMPDNLTITVFPNPNDGVFKIHFEGLDQTCFLTIVNELGQEVYAQDIVGCGGTCDQVVDMDRVASGLYFAKLKIGDLNISKRVMVR